MIAYDDDRARLDVARVHRWLAGIRRVGLVTADAHGVYAALGFGPPMRPERWMERLAPDFAAALREVP